MDNADFSTVDQPGQDTVYVPPVQPQAPMPAMNDWPRVMPRGPMPGPKAAPMRAQAQGSVIEKAQDAFTPMPGPVQTLPKISNFAAYYTEKLAKGYDVNQGFINTFGYGFTDSFHSTLGVMAGVYALDTATDMMGDPGKQGDFHAMSEEELREKYGDLIPYKKGITELTARRQVQRVLESQRMKDVYGPGNQLTQVGAGLASGLFDPANIVFMSPTPKIVGLAGKPLFGLNWGLKPIVANSAKQSIRGSTMLAVADELRMGAWSSLIENTAMEGLNLELHSLTQTDRDFADSATGVLAGTFLGMGMRGLHALKASDPRVAMAREMESISRNFKKRAADGEMPTVADVVANPVNRAVGEAADTINNATAEQVHGPDPLRPAPEGPGVEHVFMAADTDPKSLADYAKGLDPKAEGRAEISPAELSRRKALAKELAEHSWDHTDAKATNDQKWLTEIWGKTFGTKVRFLPAALADRFGVHGFIAKSDPGTIFIRSGALLEGGKAPSMMMLAGHETGHKIFYTDQKLWRNITDTILSMHEDADLAASFDQVFRHQDSRGAWGSLTAAGRMDETMATVFGRALETPEFWRRMYGQSDTGARKILTTIGKALSRIRASDDGDPRNTSLADSLARFIDAANKGTEGRLTERVALEEGAQSVHEFYQPYLKERKGWYFDRLSAMEEKVRAETPKMEAMLDGLVETTSSMSDRSAGPMDPGKYLTEYTVDIGDTDPRVWAFKNIVVNYLTPANMGAFRDVIRTNYTMRELRSVGITSPEQVGKLTAAQKAKLYDARLIAALEKGAKIEEMPLTKMSKNPDGTYTVTIVRNDALPRWNEHWVGERSISPEEVGRGSRYEEGESRSTVKEFLLDQGDEIEADFAQWLGIENYGPKVSRLLEDWLQSKSISELHDLFSGPDASVAWREFYYDLLGTITEDRISKRGRGLPSATDPEGKGVHSLDVVGAPEYFALARTLHETEAAGIYATGGTQQLEGVQWNARVAHSEEGKPSKSGGVTLLHASTPTTGSKNMGPEMIAALHELRSRGYREEMGNLLDALERASKREVIHPKGTDEAHGTAKSPSKTTDKRSVTFVTAEGKPRIFTAERPVHGPRNKELKAEPSRVKDVTALEHEDRGADLTGEKGTMEQGKPQRSAFYPKLKELLARTSEEQLGLPMSREALQIAAKDPSYFGPVLSATEYFKGLVDQNVKEIEANLPKYFAQEQLYAAITKRSRITPDLAERADAGIGKAAEQVKEKMADWEANMEYMSTYLGDMTDTARWPDLLSEMYRTNPQVREVVYNMALNQAYHESGINFRSLPFAEELMRNDMLGKPLTLDYFDRSPSEAAKMDEVNEAGWKRMEEDRMFYGERDDDFRTHETDDIAYMAGDPEATHEQNLAAVADQNQKIRDQRDANCHAILARLKEKWTEFKKHTELNPADRETMLQDNLKEAGFTPPPPDPETGDVFAIIPSEESMPKNVHPDDYSHYQKFIAEYQGLQDKGNTMINMARSWMKTGQESTGTLFPAVREIAEYFWAQTGGDLKQTMQGVTEQIQMQMAGEQIGLARGFVWNKQVRDLVRQFGPDAAKTLLDGQARASTQAMTDAGFGPLASLHHRMIARINEDAAPLLAFIDQSGVSRMWYGNELMEALARFSDTGETKDPIIRQIKEIIDQIREYQVGRANAAGANIRLREGYLWTQVHDSVRIQNAGYEAWSKAIEPIINWEHLAREQGNPNLNRQAFLKGVYEQVISDPNETFDLAKSAGNLNNTLSRRRTIPFISNVEGWKYDMQFGSGDTASAILSQIMRKSEQTVLMENMGGNYKRTGDEMVRFIRDNARSAYKPAMEQHGITGKIGQVLSNLADAAGLDNAWRVEATLGKLTGDLDHPANIKTAEIGKTARNLAFSVTGLGSGISSIVDSAHVVSSLTWAGMKMGTAELAYGKLLKDMALNPKTRDAIIGHGVAIQTLLQAYSHLDNGSVMFRAGSWLSNKTMKLSGLEMTTRANQRAYAVLLGQFLADAAKSGKLEPETINFLGMHGVSKAEFEMMGKYATRVEGLDGTFLFADMIPSRQLREKYQTMMIAASTNAALEPSVSTMGYLTGGKQGGTKAGEAFRCLGMYKSYPLTIVTKVMNRFGNGYAGHANPTIHRLSWMASSVVLASAALSIKSVLRGREPFNPLDPEQWTFANAHRVWMQAGTGYSSLADQGSSLSGIVGPVFGVPAGMAADAFSGSSYRQANMPLRIAPGASAPFVSEGYKVLLAEIMGESYSQKYQNMLIWNEQRTGQSSIFQKEQPKSK